jgi:hypothetical protein
VSIPPLLIIPAAWLRPMKGWPSSWMIPGRSRPSLIGTPVQALEVWSRQDPHSDLATSFLRCIHHDRALVLAQADRHVEAISEWDKAINYSSGSDVGRWRAWQTLSRAHLGEYARAAEEAKALAEKAPADGPTNFTLARAYSAAARGTVPIDGNLTASLIQSAAGCCMDLITDVDTWLVTDRNE